MTDGSAMLSCVLFLVLGMALMGVYEERKIDALEASRASITSELLESKIARHADRTLWATLDQQREDANRVCATAAYTKCMHDAFDLQTHNFTLYAAGDMPMNNDTRIEKIKIPLRSEPSDDAWCWITNTSERYGVWCKQ